MKFSRYFRVVCLPNCAQLLCVLIVFLIFSVPLAVRASSGDGKPSINLIQLLNAGKASKPQSRQQIPGMDFLADPSLLVTILHSLEIAYWSLPLGFVLMPIINFFRIPNRRRMGHSTSLNAAPLSDLSPRDLNKLLIRLNRALRMYRPRRQQTQ